MGHNRLSIYLSYLLRHNPGELNLDMDKHGWVSVKQLIDSINQQGRYVITNALLEEIVTTDSKGRYRFSDDGLRIKACQCHSLDWVEPELSWREPPVVLYHGTTAQACREIILSGAINRMKRHAVHMQSSKIKAWQSAKRWKKTPVILVIDAQRMARDGYRFGVSENDVWCVEAVPVEYIVDAIRQL